MKITLSRKILAGFISCTAILLTVAVISFRNSEQFLETNHWVNHAHEVLNELNQVRIAAIEAETGARGFVITGNNDYLTPYQQAQADLSEHIRKAKELVKDPEQIRNLKTLEGLTNEHLSHLQMFIDIRKKDFTEAKALVSTGESRRILNAIRRASDDAEALEHALLRERKQASEEDGKRFNLIFLFLLFIIVIVLTVVYFIIITNLRALKKAEAEAADKNWNLTGTAELIRSIQGNKGVPELAGIIINRLAAYINASVGAIYISEEDNATLKLAGTYAADKRKNEQVFIKPGEGLAGQSAAGKKTMLLHDVPDNYFTLDTSFGEIKPRMILAMPFLFENNIIGVIELGTVHPFTKSQQQYLSLVADSIAIAIVSAKSRERASELLEETQRQGEELEVQQEELRQANEELLAKTESLENSSMELKSQQEELHRTNQELEEKAGLLAQQKEKLEFAKSEIESKAGEIEVTSRYKSEFLANMSHELRTPLNSVLILAQLLSENKNGTLGEKELEFARNIHNSGTDLLNLINEILDLSKIEAGKLQLDISEFTFEDLIGDLQSMFSEVAKSKSIDFTIQFNNQALPASMVTDMQRVEQVLKNLLSNAFKFTAKGGKIAVLMDIPDPAITFRNNGLSDQRKAVAFSVTDTGVGIPQDKREVIFEAFQQADGSTKRKYGGTGLGLSISRELAHALGGEIRLESTEGKGSTFTLYLPLQFDPAFISGGDKQVEIKETPKPKENTIADIQLYETDILDDRDAIRDRDRVILIIEDDASFAQVLLNLVRERQYKGIVAHYGNTGLSYARHYKPDAIFLDIKLPVMDGTEVLKCLKRDPELRHIPVQIISAFDKRREGLELGAFNFIRKPITTSALKNAFEKIESFASKAMKKLLIIEDNEQQNNAIRELIGNGDIKSYSAFSGREAFEVMQQEAFDCIIIDLGLPDMSGFDVLEKIKADDLFNTIPIIVYTGRDLKKEDTLRLNKLANTVVLKTVDSQERLLDETILFLHRVESRLPKEKQNIIRKLHKAEDVLRDKKVLIVDDDMRNIYSLTNALEDEGITCLTAENGKASLEMLKENPSIDLVLMDVMMPEMDGYEATQAIRKLNGFQKLPIIALTAKAMKGDKEKCLAAGMSDYISKPVNIQQLLSLMRVWLYR